jgi:lipopolysaccharide export system protein LptA
LAAIPASAQKKQPASNSSSTNASNDNGILPGSNSKDPVNIDAAKLDYFDKEQKLIYTGNVVAVQGESRLLTPTLVIFLMPKEAGGESSTPSSTNNQVRRMEASGPVTLSQKDQVGTGDSGVYIKAENKVYLLGNVTLTQGPNVTKGDKLVYDLSTSQAVVTGRVKSLFLPNNNNNNNGNDDNGAKKTSRSTSSSQNPGASPK